MTVHTHTGAHTHIHTLTRPDRNIYDGTHSHWRAHTHTHPHSDMLRQARTSMMVQRARMALALYWSSLPVMSLVRLLVTMMTSSAIWDISLMARYTRRRKDTSLDWNNLVTAKNVSVASVELRCVPWRGRE